MGGGGEPLILKVYNTPSINLEDSYTVECDGEIHDNDTISTHIQIVSENIYNKINRCINNNINVIISIMTDTLQMDFVNGNNIMKSSVEGVNVYLLDLVISGISNFSITILDKAFPTE